MKLAKNYEYLVKLVESSYPASVHRLENYLIEGLNLKRLLHDLAVEVEQYVDHCEKFIISDNLLEYFMSEFDEDELVDDVITQADLWGIPVEFSNKITEGKILCIARNIDYDNPDINSLALGIVDFDKIKRVENLKVFW